MDCEFFEKKRLNIGIGRHEGTLKPNISLFHRSGNPSPQRREK
jgi:hypothetical protein